jgi:hypothetical protein
MIERKNVLLVLLGDKEVVAAGPSRLLCVSASEGNAVEVAERLLRHLDELQTADQTSALEEIGLPLLSPILDHLRCVDGIDLVVLVGTDTRGKHDDPLDTYRLATLIERVLQHREGLDTVTFVYETSDLVVDPAPATAFLSSALAEVGERLGRQGLPKAVTVYIRRSGGLPSLREAALLASLRWSEQTAFESGMRVDLADVVADKQTGEIRLSEAAQPVVRLLLHEPLRRQLPDAVGRGHFREALGVLEAVGRPVLDVGSLEIARDVLEAGVEWRQGKFEDARAALNRALIAANGRREISSQIERLVARSAVLIEPWWSQQIANMWWEAKLAASDNVADFIFRLSRIRDNLPAALVEIATEKPCAANLVKGIVDARGSSWGNWGFKGKHGRKDLPPCLPSRGVSSMRDLVDEGKRRFDGAKWEDLRLVPGLRGFASCWADSWDPAEAGRISTLSDRERVPFGRVRPCNLSECEVKSVGRGKRSELQPRAVLFLALVQGDLDALRNSLVHRMDAAGRGELVSAYRSLRAMSLRLLEARNVQVSPFPLPPVSGVSGQRYGSAVDGLQEFLAWYLEPLGGLGEDPFPVFRAATEAILDSGS